MKIRDNKGSITIFVLVGLLFMTGFLIISYASNINKSKVSKEHFNIISGIYSFGDSDEDSYDRAYAALRNKYKRIFSYKNAKDSEKTIFTNTSTVTLTKTFDEKLSDYRIYGSTTNVGKYNSSNGKYLIKIKVTNQENNTKEYEIYLSAPLKKSGTLVDYIDYKNQKIVRQVGTKTEQLISLPPIYTNEDYTKIEIIGGGTPSKIELEYTGYEFIS